MTRTPALRALLFMLLVTVGLAACSEDNPTSPGTVEVDRLQHLVGQSQIGVAGGAILNPPAVIARDAADQPMVGLRVRFEVTRGGGSVSPEAYIETDEFGVARVSSWTMGPVVGVNELRATIEGGGTAVETSFTAVSVAADPDPSRSSLTGGSGAGHLADGKAHATLELELLDAFENRVPGRSVHLAVAEGQGATLSPGPWMSDENGKVTVTVRSSQIGIVRIRATSGAKGEGKELGEALVHFIGGEANAQRSTVSGHRLWGVIADGEAYSTVTVRVRDQMGNLREAGADDVFFVTDLGEITAAVAGEEPGTYTATVSSRIAASARVTAYLGADQSGSEIGAVRVGFVAGPADAEASTLEVPWAGATIGSPGSGGAQVIVTVRDQFGNVRVGGQDEVEFASDLGHVGKVVSLGDGRYAANLTSMHPGDIDVRASFITEIGRATVHFDVPALFKSENWSVSTFSHSTTSTTSIESLDPHGVRLIWDQPGGGSLSEIYTATADRTETLHLAWDLEFCNGQNGWLYIQAFGPDGSKGSVIQQYVECPWSGSGIVTLEVHEGYDVRVWASGWAPPEHDFSGRFDLSLAPAH